MIRSGQEIRFTLNPGEIITSTEKLAGTLNWQDVIEGKKHFLKGEIVIGEDVTLESLLGNTSELKLEKNAQNVYFQDTSNNIRFNILGS